MGKNKPSLVNLFKFSYFCCCCFPVILKSLSTKILLLDTM